MFVQYLPINPVVGTMGGTPFDIMGTLTPTAMGTGGTIPIVGMPSKRAGKCEVGGVTTVIWEEGVYSNSNQSSTYQKY